MPCHEAPKPVTRRQALSMIGGGFGLVAFSNMLNSSLAQAAAQAPHFKPRAKRIIFLFMNGGVSHVDTFDPKPMLEKYDGKPMPGPQVLTQRKTGNLMKSPFKFQKYGECGTELSELWPNVGGVADDICVIRSMWSEIPNHEPCITMMNTGANIIGRPSMGAWITYGLGTENQNLPGYVVLTPTEPLTIGSPLWSSAFLPAIYQGTVVHNTWVEDEPFQAGKVIPNVMNVKDRELQSRDVGFLRHLNEMHLARLHQKDSELEASIKTMETAFRMQTEAPDVFDVSKESKAVLDLYGPGSTALGCLMAVRLVEKGVRYIQICNGGGGNGSWDAHVDMKDHERSCRAVDKPIAGLIRDLKQRGMLDSTLVVFSSDFGRTPWSQNTTGRDHNPRGYSVWLAGGGVKGGVVHGATDEVGYRAVENPHYCSDLHATILHQLGLDHHKMNISVFGRTFHLVEEGDGPIKAILA